jgi:hypothetical protein
MLNTALWTNSHGNGTALATPEFMEGILPIELLETIPVHGITETRLPEKPYVYGRSTAYARRLLIRNCPTLSFPQ